MRLVVDPVKCDGRGLCAEVVPELVGLDDWGFPMASKEPLEREREREAGEAVRLCPRLALKLVP